jgi:eukaryotic-like serine/threonine-protein kinase
MVEAETDAVGPGQVVGRYALYGRLAAGGMATVHLGRHVGPVGHSRPVAVKRLHPQFCKDPEFVAMFIDEARLAARIKHPNVVATLDILTMGQELLLVMEYIRGECFSKLLRAARRKNLEPTIGVVGAIASGMLHGLNAAHDATDERGELLNVVHRDVSPQNVMVGVDGVPRVLDFGVAKASARIQITRDGQMKGKLSYMSPEQLQGIPVDRRADVFAAGVVMWEALTRRRLFVGEDASDVLRKILKEDVPAPSELVPGLSPELDQVVLRALCKDPERRYQNARDVALDIERIIDLASPAEVGQWVESVAGEVLGKREAMLQEVESISEQQVALDSNDGALGPITSYGSVSDRQTFDRIQSWASEASRRSGGFDDDSDDSELVETVADARGGGVDGVPSSNERRAASVNDSPFTPVTASHLHEESALVAAATTNSPLKEGQLTGPRAIISELPPASSRRRRAATLVLAAAAFLSLGAFSVFGLRQAQILGPDGSLQLGSRPTAAAPVAVPELEESALSPRSEVARVGREVRSDNPEADARGRSRLASASEKKDNSPVKPTASTYALTPAPKPATAPPPPAPAPAPARPAAKKAVSAAQTVRPAAASADKRKEECREPYWVDSRGIRRLRLDCL